VLAAFVGSGRPSRTDVGATGLPSTERQWSDGHKFQGSEQLWDHRQKVVLRHGDPCLRQLQNMSLPTRQPQAPSLLQMSGFHSVCHDNMSVTEADAGSGPPNGMVFWDLAPHDVDNAPLIWLELEPVAILHEELEEKHIGSELAPAGVF